ncbi:MAG: CHASE2 domain-containing protein [Nitrospiraceae bacterium]|nr:CHASE2 domain-containing protein [Nitrospiraceae bacterium]
MNFNLKIFRVSLFATVMALALSFSAEYMGLYNGIDSYFYNMSFRIRGAKPVSERIIIVAVDEKSLKEFGRWPIPRKHYARMLDNLEQASVVGFDILFTEPTKDDNLLEKAMKKHKNAVLPVYIDNSMHIEYSSPLLSSYKAGHVHIELGINGLANSIYHTIYHKEAAIPSLTSVIYESDRGYFAREKIPAQTARSKKGLSLLQQDFKKINYYGPAGQFQRVSMADVVSEKYSPSFFLDKIVLVGVTAPGIADDKHTPFSQERNTMPGVEVFANALNNLLDNNSIKDVPIILLGLIVIFFSLFMFFLLMKFKEKWIFIFWFLSLFLTSIAVYLLFSVKNIWMNPSLFYSSFSLTFMFIYLYKLNSAAKKLDEEHSMINSLLATNTTEKAKIVHGKGFRGLFSVGGINSKIETLLSLERLYEQKLEDTVQKRTHELSQAISMISNLSNEMILRLTKAVECKEGGTGEHIVRVSLYAKHLSEALRMPNNFIETIEFASAMHDIGKLGIPDKILLKPDKLTREEMEIMKTHCVLGERILADSLYPKIQMSAVIALNHHERWDGTGYPNHLNGEKIPIEARILILCDCYDALRSKRPYKPAYSHQETLAIITKGNERTSPEHFDPQVLRAFIESAGVFEGIFNKYPNVS